MKKSCLRLVIMVIFIAFAFIACGGGDDKDENTNTANTDVTPPQFDGISMITASNSDTVFLSWLPATDNVTRSKDLLYRVYYSLTPDFDTAKATMYAEKRGETEITVSGLSAGTGYSFLVTAQDQAGNSNTNKIYKSAATAKTPSVIRNSVSLIDTQKKALSAPTADQATGTYEFATTDKNAPQTGQHIVGKDSSGNGFLRKVGSVRQEGGKTVAETSQASLSDIFQTMRLDSNTTLTSLDNRSDITGVKRTVRSKSGADETVVYRKQSSTFGSFSAEEIRYGSDENGYQDSVVRTHRSADKKGIRKQVSALDGTKRLRIVSENRMVRAGGSIALPVVAYLVDENGQIKVQQELGIKVSFQGLFHDSIPDTRKNNYGAYFDSDKGLMNWIVRDEYVSDKPYKAIFQAHTVLSDLTVQLEIAIDVLPQSKNKAVFSGTNYQWNTDVDFYFEPELRTKIETDMLGNVTEGEITAVGDIGVNMDALFEFTAWQRVEKDARFFQRTWTTTYMVGSVPVYQDITMTLDIKGVANAEAAITASAFGNLNSHLEFGIRYNPQTGQWDFVKDADFDKKLTFNLSVEGKLNAEVRLIPKIDVTFYKAATGSFYLEPYLGLSVAAEWLNDADVLSKILISQYQMKDMSAWAGVDGFFGADLSVWKWNVWKMDKTPLFSSKFPLFDLPQIDLSKEGGKPPNFVADVTDGTNNPFDKTSVSWNAYPAAVFKVDQSNPLRATLSANKIGNYKVYFSGNSAFGALTRQYDTVEVNLTDCKDLDGIPKIEKAIADAGQITVVWNAVEGAKNYNIYAASAPGVNKNNYKDLADGIKEENVSSPYMLVNLNHPCEGKTYYIVVTAVTSAGESDECGETSASLPPLKNSQCAGVDNIPDSRPPD